MTTENTPAVTKPLTARQLRQKIGSRTSRAQTRKVAQYLKAQEPRNTK